MRLKYTLYNYLANFLPGFLLMAFTLYRSKVFVSQLGLAMSGIEGAIGNTLSYLHILEAGMGTAILVSLYQPAGENNWHKINQLVTGARYYVKKIAVRILLVGMAVMLIIPWLLTDAPMTNSYLYAYFFIVLIKSIIGFIFYIPSVVLDAHQEGYRFVWLNTLITFMITIGDIILLKLGYGLIVLALWSILIYLAQFYICRHLISRWYPQFRWLSREEMDLSPIKKTKDLVVHKIAEMILTNTDRLVISTFVNVTQAGVYSIYDNLFAKMWNYIHSIIFSSTSSLGNYFAVESKENKYRVLHEYMMMTFYLAIVAFIPMLLYAQMIAVTWYNSDKTMLTISLWVIGGFTALRFYATTRAAVGLCLDLHGYFKETKFCALIEAGVNMIVSIILVILMPDNCKILGVILGTMIAFLVTNFWYYPYLCYKLVFDKKPYRYFLSYASTVVLFVILSAIYSLTLVKWLSVIVVSQYMIINILVQFMIVGLINAVIAGSIFYLFSYHFRLFVQRFIQLFKRKLTR